MRAQHGLPGRPTVGTLIGFGLLTVVSVTLMFTVLVRRIVSPFEPSIGEMAVFNPSRQGNEILQLHAVQVAVANLQGEPLSGVRCMLAPEVMAKFGGSLIIEVRRGGADPAYVVHWAGGMTSAGTSNCGNDVDVVVTKPDLMELVGPGGFQPGQ